MADHRELARDMDLFHFEEHSPGMVFWHPQGLRLFRSIEDLMRQVYQGHVFEEVRSPHPATRLGANSFDGFYCNSQQFGSFVFESCLKCL